MTEESDVARHYSSGNLQSRIHAALAEAGLSEPLDPDALAPLDEFHIGGRETTARLVDKLDLGPGKYALDMGCGLGGAARHVARRTGAAVVGVDLTSEFIAAGLELTGMCGLADRVKHVRASITNLPFNDGLFDAVYMIHVGMNIADKHRLAQEAARVLKPGGRFGICDVMRLTEDDIPYPVPWASSRHQSSVMGADRYRFLLEDVGFDIVSDVSLAGFALDSLDSLIARVADPGPLGLHLVMGEDAGEKVANMAASIRAGHIAPHVIVGCLPG
ncbi:class I SAM-dependent methyltransferase [Marinibacterium sp. SX1]|uniref:class I SAM-dependent methyltransferase n=1 Tax=Marinibacterium sp. SX1 TaxID=3388424 RepID=UPI003D177C04